MLRLYQRVLLTAISLLLTFILFLNNSNIPPSISTASRLLPSKFRTSQPERNYTQSLVVASTTHEDTSWTKELTTNLTTYIYLADDETAPLHPPQNKGHETMIYLTYIIDHYHNLSDITIFTHSSDDSWHNNDLQSFSLHGYFNLRCHHESGCPDHIKPYATEHSDKDEERHFLTQWPLLHGEGAEVPETLATACCAQFAASREAILRVPLSRWEHYRQWFIDTPLEDSISGRIWEFTWQWVLTSQAVVCPSVQACYCGGYGLCFESEAEIMSWLTMKSVADMAKETVRDFEDRERDKGGVEYYLWQKMQRPLNKWLYEAEVRERIRRLGRD
ncbi:hypothetical protein H2203_002241 [Taxawa tesnikishii (nom. ined.)]|nr:hypothetical protein H2203_002241 [Dothideales sp. JES 119]